MGNTEHSKLPLAHRRARDTAHDGIRDAVLNGDLDPGEQLNAARLEGRFDVPTAAIHDAMTALVAEGLLHVDDDELFSVVDPDPESVGDTLKTIGVLMGGVIRQTVPPLSPDNKDILLERVARVRAAAMQQDARSHAHRTLEFYAALLLECPNPVLSELTRSSLVPLSYHYLVTIDRREVSWPAIIAAWDDVRVAISASDQIRAELAIEALHGLPALQAPIASPRA